MKWSVTLTDRLGPEILTVLEIKGQVLHRVRLHVKVPGWLLNLNALRQEIVSYLYPFPSISRNLAFRLAIHIFTKTRFSSHINFISRCLQHKVIPKGFRSNFHASIFYNVSNLNLKYLHEIQRTQNTQHYEKHKITKPHESSKKEGSTSRKPKPSHRSHNSRKPTTFKR